MKKISYLLTGGVRSGKSSYALKIAESAKRPFYIATSWEVDTEMSERIIRHKKERSKKWITIEEKYDLNIAIKTAEQNNCDIILIDCITMWISNLMYAGYDIENFTKKFVSQIKKTKVPIIMVTNEVGLGIVPETETGRKYRDILGIVNQKIAEAVDKVIFMVSGIPVEIK